MPIIAQINANYRAALQEALLKTGEYKQLPTVDVYLAMELGLVNESWVNTMRAQQTESEWIRQFLCINTRSTNHIHERYIRLALATGINARLQPAGPLPGARYKRRGLISFGYDHSGHGENPTASRSTLVVSETIGNFVTFPYVQAWPAGTDDKVVEDALYGLCDYFRPDVAMGDAFGVGMLTSLNDRLFRDGLTDIDRMTIGDGQSTQSTWQNWAFAPIRFIGMTKHSMAAALRAIFHNRRAAIAEFDEDDTANVDWMTFVRQLGNVKALPTQAGYSSYKMADGKIGDDFFDAACAAVWALVTRGAEAPPSVVLTGLQSRESLLEGR